MKYLFFIQTDGRGHMTQALALKEKLENRGHSIIGAIVGANKNKPLPGFFTKQIDCPLFFLESPKFLLDKKGKGIKVFASILFSLYKLPKYLQSIKNIKKIINNLKPNVLINFYEPIAGAYYKLSKDTRPMFCIGHQHFIEHPSFKYPSISLFAQLSFKFYNNLVSGPRTTKIALSFTKETDLKDKKIFVCPPLIRDYIKKQEPSDDNFILAYLLNSGYAEEIIKWSKNNPNYKVEAFWDKLGEPETHFGKNLTFHYLSGKKFINKLVHCTAYAATAGFDSIAEAAYLQKKILMIPTKKHFEQKCNAIDAKRAGIAFSSNHFDISSLMIKKQKTQSKEFKDWVDKYDNKIVNILEK